MKLHRLVLTNYRGITHREIEFPDRGVVVVAGANEIGKSSMIEALDLLLESKDRSTKKEVKQVKPTHADVGAEVLAEISTGPYRFEYFKRFHKRAETRLTILAPRREQLTGDEAHDRVRSMLDETVDTELWRAQRILQSAATIPVDLAGCDALARALDVAAGQAGALEGALSGNEPLLVDRIDTEYGKYFTATGRATGEWAAAIKALKDAQAETDRCANAVAEVDDAIRHHGELTTELSGATEQLMVTGQRLTQAREAAEAVGRLRDELAQASVQAQAAVATATAARSALDERRRLQADVEARSSGIGDLAAAAERAAQLHVAAQQTHQTADAAVTAARTVLDAARVRAESSRRVVDQLAQRAEADRVSGQLDRIQAAADELAQVHEQLAGIALTGAALRDIDAAVTAVERAASAAELASARIELTAVADMQVQVGGQDVILAAGTEWTTSVGGRTDIEVPGLLRVRVLPGTPAADTTAALDAARAALAAALEPYGLDDVRVAHAVDAHRRELEARRNRLDVTMQTLLGDDTVDALAGRLAQLREQLSGTDPSDPDAARAELAAADAGLRCAVTDYDDLRDATAASSTAVAEALASATVARDKQASALTALADATERLARQREQEQDAALAVRATNCSEQADIATTRHRELAAALAATTPDAVDAELVAAAAAANGAATHRQDIDGQLRDVTAQLKVYGTQGRQSQKDVAEANLRHAQSDHASVGRRARAAEMLRTVMGRHREQARQRYVEPFRKEVERLGRIVFGDTFTVDIDSDLRICSRTVDGRTVPYESLSGGAKEQLGIVARLAGAALVAKEDSVPVIIDDALGFTDANRLVRMGQVFDAVGGDGQVIVLTCSPDRYVSVEGAERIELTA
ncbi:AAA family ATPase [Mycobacterium sp. OTB74]|jgi:DNA repair exonuclease SbcCD ATPase subunit|uniref:AAA family ATPase n=1 Tax=Mycobacterium sp. OTB74 TaxID=1853452 RepID=UPI00247718BD|nr:AAA family ATPase [Mycobacterium sp. OTB74]MDH6244508.1 DNA repair exonuclease SbcCD ATPase subunit [Mycobacterium sp. OTB74]